MIVLIIWSWALLAAATFAFPQTAVRALSQASNYAPVDTYVQAQMAAWHIRGAALIIVQGDRVVHLRTFGQAGAGRPVTPQTPFEIGSCTKSFTALAVMQLVEAGRVDLDAPVQHYLPWFRVADAEASGRITVRHLLNHTSGLPTRAANRQTMINPGGRTLEDQVRFLQSQPLTAPSGTLYQYSNLNYMTLALIIEAVSRQSYGGYLRGHVFAPLNLKDSYSDPAVARQHGLSDGHTWWFGFPVKSLEGYRTDMLGAGYLMLSADDMARWLIAQLNGGTVGGVSLLSPQGIAAMQTPARPLGGDSIYGMGWVRYQEGGQTVVNHNGQSASFTCSMILLPRQGTGVAVLANVASMAGPHAAWSLADSVKSMLVTGQPSAVDPAFRRFLLSWDIGFLLATGFLLWSVFYDLPRWRRKMLKAPPRTRRETLRRVALPAGVDALVALAAFLGLPLAVGFEVWGGMFVWQPDAVFWCLAVGVVQIGKLATRVVWLQR